MCSKWSALFQAITSWRKAAVFVYLYPAGEHCELSSASKHVMSHPWTLALVQHLYSMSVQFPVNT